jgi:hypothetical protein
VRILTMRLGRWSRALAPGYSWCLRCETPWRFVTPHYTQYDPSRGCFPLCEKCWTELETPEARLLYYLRMVQDRPPPKVEMWQKIKKAVLAGG